MSRFGVTGMVRVSLTVYNTEEEIDILLKSLNRAVNMLRQ
jgi:selenocysteine lyase/cysteine desulfurase